MESENKSGEFKLEEQLNLAADFTPPTYEEWKKVAEKDLKGVPFEKKLVTKTLEDIKLNPLYTRGDIEDIKFKDELPGTGSFVRGFTASGYRGKEWEVCQNIPYADAEEFNAALKHDLERGQTAISLTLDKATQMGLDADYAGKEIVGKGGISVSAYRSLNRALKDIDLEKYPIYVKAGFSALPFISVFNAWLKNSNKDISKLKGSIEADPVSWLAENGELPVSEETAFSEMNTVLDWAKTNAPGLRTIGINGAVWHNAGASAVQELAFSMATAIEYLKNLSEKGKDIKDIASSMRFTFGTGTFYFMEIAKFRAARLIWTNIMKAFGVNDIPAMKVHAETSKFSQTEYDPYVNMLRTTTEAFSAVVGGVDSMHTNAFDEVFGLPDEFSRRISRNTQIILNEESHLNNLIDPVGGSYYVEKLTEEVAEKTWELTGKIDDLGGIIQALRDNFPQSEIETVNAQRNKEIAKRKRVIVGTNMYANLTEVKKEKRMVDHDKFYRMRSEYLQKFRTSGDNTKHQQVLEKLQELVDAGGEGLIEKGSEIIITGGTIGEISKAVRPDAGNPVCVIPLKFTRASEPFEELRDASAFYKKETGKAPGIFLANMGSLKQHKGRADFSRGFFEAGGFDVTYPAGFKTPEEAADAFLASGNEITVICSTDDTYPEIVPALVKLIKDKKGDATVVLAGYPKDQVEAHKEAGVDEFIFLGADVYKILSGLLKKTGVIK